MSSEMAELEPLVFGAPDQWKVTTLGGVLAKSEGGGTPPRDVEHYWNGDIPWASVKDVVKGEGSVPEETISSAGLANSTSKLIPAGTNIFAARMGVGAVVRYPFPVAINQDLMALTPSPELDPEFLFYWVQAHKEAFVAVATGTTVKGIRKDILLSFQMILPPQDEQRRIAEVLRSVDKAIAATRSTLQAVTSLRQIVLDTLIQESLDASTTEVRPLADFAEVRTGLAKNKNRSGLKVPLPYLRVANVQDGWFDLSDMQEIEVAPDQIERYLLQAGDVLLTEGGDYDKLGRGGVWHGEIAPCLHQNHVFCVRPDSARILPDYFALVTQSAWGRAYFLSCSKRTTNLASINSSQLKSFPVPMISTTQQTQLIDKIAGIDAMIALEEENLETLLRLRTAVSSDLLSGRVRVPIPQENKTKAKKVAHPAFKRAVFAAEVVNQLHTHSRFGSVKHEKIVHLCELHLDLHEELDRHAYKEAAGPYDPKARRSVESIFAKQKWFETSKQGGNRVVYTPLEKCGAHKSYFDTYFGNRKDAIQSVIDLLRPLDTTRCEIIATLYAVWNDFLIDGVQPTDDMIVASVLSWHPKKAEIPESRWRAALPWLREKGLVPTGKGEKTRVVAK